MRRLLAQSLAVIIVVALVAMPASASAKTYIGQPLEVGGHDVFREYRPSSLLLGEPDAPLALTMGVRRVRGRAWGHSAAIAKGKTRFKAYDPWTPVSVRVYRLRTCNAKPKFRLYTRAKTTISGHATTWRLPSCSDVMGYMD
jgi:hypothetical protein